MRTRGPGWRTSTYSSNGSDCVEVLFTGLDTVRMGDSKNPAGETIAVMPQHWTRFVRGIQDGDFNQ